MRGLKTLWGAAFLVALVLRAVIDRQPAPEPKDYDRMFESYIRGASDRLLGDVQHRGCQALWLESFHEESAVYVKYDRFTPDAPPMVVSTELESQLWHQMVRQIRSARLGSPLETRAQKEALKRIESRTRRAEAPIDGDIAVLLERVWQRALLSGKLEAPTLGLDGESTIFGVLAPSGMFSTFRTWSPHHGTLNRDLVDLAKDLRAYPHIPLPAGRISASMKIREKAQKLLARLDAC